MTWLQTRADGNTEPLSLSQTSGEAPQEDYWSSNLALLGDGRVLCCYVHWDHLAESVAQGKYRDKLETD